MGLGLWMGVCSDVVGLKLTVDTTMVCMPNVRRTSSLFSEATRSRHPDLLKPHVGVSQRQNQPFPAPSPCPNSSTHAPPCYPAPNPFHEDQYTSPTTSTMTCSSSGVNLSSAFSSIGCSISTHFGARLCSISNSVSVKLFASCSRPRAFSKASGVYTGWSG
jgi:hypothetical protein